jgi:hypothetical protein
MESKVRLVTKFRQMLAGLMVGILVMSQACSGITPVYANEKHNTALFLISGENLKNAYSEALESEAFDYTSLNLGAKTSVEKQYEELLGGDAVYRLDKNILNIDDSSAPQGTAMDVFVNTDRESFIFLYENQSDVTVTFRADVDGYQTDSVTVKPNTENLEEDEADFGVNYNNESGTQTSVATDSDASKQKEEDNTVVSVASDSDASKEDEEDLSAVSAATDSDASKQEEDNTVSVATDSDASEWQEDVKDSDEQMLENDTELLGKLSGTEYDTVTLGENLNAKALEIPMSALNFLFSRSRRGAPAVQTTYSSDMSKIYLQPDNHTHTDGYTATTLEKAYNLAVEKGIKEIYICSAVYITEDNNKYINNPDITFVRCEQNTTDYLMDVINGNSVVMDGTHIDGQEIPSTCSLIYVSKGSELTITGDTVIKNGVTKGNSNSDTNTNTSANGNGGAILVYDGTLRMTGGTITENTVINTETTININDYRNGCGGAIYIYSDDQGEALAEFDGGTISNNYAGKYGGAICAQYATVNFGTHNGDSTEVTGNTAFLSGSGICYGTESSGKIYQAEFTGNSTESEYTTQVSGAISIVKGAYVEMKNVYVSGNTTEYNYTKQCALYSCPTSHLAIFQEDGATIIDNGTTAANVGDIYYDGAAEAYISEYDMLGTKIDYYNYSSNKWTATSLTQRAQNGYQYTDNNFGMYWKTTSDMSAYKAQAKTAADVIITGNYGCGPGCAIANNGTLIIGTPAKALKVKKEWKDKEGDILSEHPSEVTVCLADKDGNKLSRSDAEVTLNADNNWSYVWSDLESVDNITVQEKLADELVDEYTPEITQPLPESGFDWFSKDNFYVATIVNRLQPTTESEKTRTKTLRVTKEWQDSDGNTIDAPAGVESVTVHLLEDNNPIDTNSDIDAEKTLNSSNNWSAAWTDLDHSKSWTIEEDSVDGYTPSYTYGANYLSTVNGSEVVSCEIKIVNKQKPSDQNKTQTLEVKKEWLDHDEHPLSEHPAQVTVRLLANGSEVSTDTVKDSVIVLNEGKNWDYIWKDLDDNTTWSVKEDAVDGYTSVIKTLVLSGDEAEAFASDTYYEITILNIKNEPEPASEEPETIAPDPSEEEPETTAPETSATEPETTAPETSATEPETTAPETSATEPETTVPETTGSSSGGGPSPKESTEPRETTQSDDNPTEAPTESATEPVTESATAPETLPETQPSVSESMPEETQPEKPIHPELPEIPVTPEGEPDIPEGTEVEIYDLDDTSDPVYTGPYEEESLNLPPGDYEIVVIDDEGVPLAAGLFTIDEDGIPQSMGLPKTGDTSIPFVLLALLLAGSGAGMAVLTTRMRHMDE